MRSTPCRNRRSFTNVTVQAGRHEPWDHRPEWSGARGEFNGTNGRDVAIGCDRAAPGSSGQPMKPNTSHVFPNRAPVFTSPFVFPSSPMPPIPLVQKSRCPVCLRFATTTTHSLTIFPVIRPITLVQNQRPHSLNTFNLSLILILPSTSEYIPLSHPQQPPIEYQDAFPNPRCGPCPRLWCCRCRCSFSIEQCHIRD